MTPILLFGVGLLLVMALSGGASASDEGAKIGPGIEPPLPEPGDFPLPESDPMAPGGGLSPVPGQGPGGGGLSPTYAPPGGTAPGPGSTSPGSGLPTGVSPGEAVARERAARAEADARGARARAAAAEAARQREAAGRAAAEGRAAAAREAAGRAAAAQAAAAAEARAARAAEERAEAARREAEGRAAAEAAARSRDAQAAAERAQKDATRIAQLEGLVNQARGAANQKIREAQDATAKANAAIRAANDAKAAAGRARTAAEKAQANANVRVKAEQARAASAEAAAKRAQAAVAEAQARAQEAQAALARAEKARKDAIDASTAAATEKDATKRAAAQREAQLKEQLARAEEEKARIASANAAKAKETAASAAQVARDVAKPVPGPSPTPLPTPGPQPAPGPATAVETSPAVLEQKRQVIAKAFKAAVDKVIQGYQRAGKKITQQQAVNLVNSAFLAKGIPTGKPNAKDPRWKTPIRDLADKAAATVNSISVPAPKAASTSAPKPATLKPTPAPQVVRAPTIDQTSPAALERKRQVIARAFTAAVNKAQKTNPRLTKQQATNLAAKHFTAQKIPLTKPSPGVAFWKQDEKVIADRAATVVNIFAPPPGAPTGPRPTPMEPTKPTTTKPRPSVTVDVEERKGRVVAGTYTNIVDYAIKAFQQRTGKTLTPQQARVLVFKEMNFPMLANLRGVSSPDPTRLTEPSPYFANTLPLIEGAMQRAFADVKKQIDFFTTTTVASPGEPGARLVKLPNGKTAWVKQSSTAPIAWTPPVPDAPPGKSAVSGEFYTTRPLKGGLITFGWAS